MEHDMKPIWYPSYAYNDYSDGSYVNVDPDGCNMPGGNVHDTKMIWGAAIDRLRQQMLSISNNNNIDASSPSLMLLITSGAIASVATDEIGSRLIQQEILNCETSTRQLLFEYLIEKGGFDWLCYDAHGNFVVQKVIEEARGVEQFLISGHIGSKIVKMCFNRFGSRIVQKVFEKFEFSIKCDLLKKFSGSECVLSVDHNATHVIQKLFTYFPPSQYGFIVQAFTITKATFKQIVENKFGCRVVQSALERLEAVASLHHLVNVEDEAESNHAKRLLKKILKRLVENCAAFTSHNFANYIIQHIIQSDMHVKEREQIIQISVLRNVLSLSQEKFASHVVEQALRYSSANTLALIMEEVFDGYVPNERGHDALDIMLFDSYANYVVQKMLDIALEVRQGIRVGDQAWLDRLIECVAKHESKLKRYSSGKKIIEKIKTAPPQS